LILLDSNILLRYAKTADPAYPTVDTAITTLGTSGTTLCIVPQNIYEFWAAATRPVGVNGLGLSVAEAQVEIVRLRRLFAFLPDRANLFAEWETLVVAYDCKGKVAHDARLVAAMRTHGITRLLTFNGPDFQRYPGVTILDPAAIAVTPTPPAGTP
jgi:predicted nucleic acid-binding protein